MYLRSGALHANFLLSSAFDLQVRMNSSSLDYIQERILCHWMCRQVQQLKYLILRLLRIHPAIFTLLFASSLSSLSPSGVA